MPVQVRKLNDAQPPATIRFYWRDEPVELRYLPGQLTNAWRRQVGSRPVRTSLALILAGWDVEGDDGAPFQPPDAGNTDHWRSVLETADQDIAEGLPALPEGPDRDAIATTYAAAQARPEELRIRDAYVAAWEQHLDEIGDTEFLIACLNAVADDFLGVAPSKKRSGVWLGLKGGDGYPPWWYSNLVLSRMFPQYRFDYWSTEDGQVWADRVWTALAAERLGKAMRGEQS